MALWKVTIQKHWDIEYWTNSYTVEAATLDDAHDAGMAIALLEVGIHSDQVLFDKMTVGDNIPGTDVFRTTILSANGERAAVGALDPLFNVVRVDFSVGQGRPSRKYLRGILVENDAVGSNIASGLIDFINAEYVQPLIDLAAYVDVDGQAITSGSCYELVAMRQLRRGSKRRLAPII